VAIEPIAQPTGEMREPLRLVDHPARKDRLSWLRDLYERHSDYVRDVVARHAGPGLDAEDLVQEVFIAADRKWERLRDYKEPRAWLHVAAMREVWAARRRQRLSRLFRLRFGETPSSPEGPEAAYQNKEASDLFYSLIDRIPEKQRAAFLLFHIENKTSGEIAKLLGVPEPTVRTRLFHARRAFAAAAERWRMRTESHEAPKNQDDERPSKERKP
jgi:RNA polymerase sigma-70 factor (ECF subfamily)